ncbi:hypothetical protein DLAC_00508 [Tieghemostelium lacteum]|uniref:Uncharacterized protein n=1 Tax=Tieghemostelium lacteum TaxID=361077 RepID=A0A152A9X3_TIELA|nr:hypothetical protein DLAC_00508 [Tieghemostelium lacteum]|eukprot:KYR03020.1 hypothetical protein DLAC_00508 [Tieghemostelium lacteum]
MQRGFISTFKVASKAHNTFTKVTCSNLSKSTILSTPVLSQTSKSSISIATINNNINSVNSCSSSKPLSSSSPSSCPPNNTNTSKSSNIYSNLFKINSFQVISDDDDGS